MVKVSICDQKITGIERLYESSDKIKMKRTMKALSSRHLGYDNQKVNVNIKYVAVINNSVKYSNVCEIKHMKFQLNIH